MDPILEFVLKSGVVGFGAYLWIRDMNTREARVARETKEREEQRIKENADRELRLATAIEKRDDRILEQAREQTSAVQKFTTGIEQNTAATKSLEAAIKENGCKFFEGKNS